LSPATPSSPASTSPPVTGVDFATVFVTNYDEAAKFYGTVLGLPCSSDGVCHMAFFEDPDGNTLILHNRYAPRASG
jgi:hypothetical protein